VSATRLRYLLRPREVTNRTHLQVLSVYRDHGVIPKDSRSDNFNKTPEDITRYQEVRTGDLVVNKMKAWQGSVGISAHHGIVSHDYLVCSVAPSVNSRFMHHFLRSAPLIAQYGVRSKGIRPAQWRLYWEDLAEIPVTLPTRGEQRRIADFLDAETARIDALSRTYEATKSTLNERVQCLIDMFIDDAGKPVPLKHFVRFREGPGIMAIDFRDEGTPLIRVSGLRDGIVTLNGANYLDNDMVATRWPQFRLHLGDYIISGSATMGAVSIVKDPAVVGAIPYTGLIILRQANADVVMEYVATALTSDLFMRQIDLLKAGATMQHFGPTHLAQVSLPFPASERQFTIASAVREIREQASKVTASIDRQLALLSERRQALITAAVTGGISV
jgi:type I restriction enzyme S subunit